MRAWASGAGCMCMWIDPHGGSAAQYTEPCMYLSIYLCMFSFLHTRICTYVKCRIFWDSTSPSLRWVQWRPARHGRLIGICHGFLLSICLAYKRFVRAMAKRPRAKNGEGRAAKQTAARNKLAAKVAKWLLPWINANKVEATGCLFPRGCLKKKGVRRLTSSWLHKLDGRRCFTKCLLHRVCDELVHKLGFIPPRQPSVSFQDYLGQQSARLGAIIRQAKKARSDSTLAWICFWRFTVIYVCLWFCGFWL